MFQRNTYFILGIYNILKCLSIYRVRSHLGHIIPRRILYAILGYSRQILSRQILDNLLDKIQIGHKLRS